MPARAGSRNNTKKDTGRGAAAKRRPARRSGVGAAIQSAGKPLAPPKRTLPPGPRGDTPRTRKQDTRRAEQHKRTPQYKRDLRDAREQRQRRETKKALAQTIRAGARAEEQVQTGRRPGGTVGTVRANTRPVTAGTTAAQAALIKTLKTPQQRRQAIRAIQREASTQQGKQALRTAIQSAPRAKYDLYPRKGFLEAFLTGRDTSLTSDAQGRVRPAPKAKGADAAIDAAALKVLNQTTRVTRGVAGATREAIKGQPEKAPGALAKGVVKNKGPLFGDVLREAGAPDAVAAVGGLTADILTDPTTYVTFGTGSVAKKAAQNAATRAAQKAAKAGMSEAGQQTVARAAARKAAAAAKTGTGVTVRFGGKELPGVRAGTAAVGRVTRARKPQGKLRTAGRQVNPRISPRGVDADEFATMKQSERRARATRSEARRRAVDRGRLLADKLKPDEYAKVVDAIERGTIKDLPENLRPIAKRLRDDFKYELRLRRRAGVSTGDVTRKPGKGDAKGYVPHVSDDTIPGKQKRPAATRTVHPASSRRRTDRRPISEQNVERARLGAQGERAGEAPYSTNLPNLYADYVARSGNARAQAQIARDLAEQGRKVGKSPSGIKLEEGESVYHVGGATGTSKETTRGIRKVDPNAPRVKDKTGELLPNEFDTLLTKGVTDEGGKYVVLKDDIVEEAYRNLGTERTAIGAGFDKVMGGWKTLATGTPAFHIRNMIGDTQMAYLGQRGYRMPTNVRAASRALREQTRRDVAQKSTVHGRAQATGKTVKLGGKTVTAREFVDELMENGVLRSGQRGRELEDLLSGTGEVRARNLTTRRARVRAKASKAWGPVERAMQNREDLMRAATYKEARDRGMSPAQAADWSMKHHIDYGDLTEAERVFGRRAAPFYTFTARALPLHAQRLVTNPGKFATIEKVRQETAGAFGMGEDWEKDLPEYKQRSIPFGVKIGGTKMALDAALPINTLNELPGFKKPGEQLGEWGTFLAGLATPAGKVPVELLANRSFFFRRDIESDARPLVSAPGWAKWLPKDVQDTLGLTKIKDRRSGKMVLGWPGRTDYIVRQVPGMAALMNSLTTEGAGRSGRAGWEKWASATGVKFDPVDGDTTAIFRLFDEQRQLEKQRNALKQQNLKGGTRSTHAKVRDLSKRISDLDERIYELSVKRGDAEPYKEESIGKGKAAQIRNKATGKQPASTGAGLTPGQQRMLEQRTTGATGLTPGQQKMLEARMGR